jgi:hypothetical protein
MFLTTVKKPDAEKFLRPYISTDDFVNGEVRWILALQKASPAELKNMPEVLRRMRIVSQKRSESKRKQTKKLAPYPATYNITVVPEGEFLVVPEASSEQREYVPIAYLRSPVIPSNLVRIIENASVSLFGILTSRMHMAWLRYIGGRLKSDPRYSIGLVYNPFPWPFLSPAAETQIGILAQAVLDARANHSDSTLADVYDPTSMPTDLRRAHQTLDAAVDRLYRTESFNSDRERVEFLLARYEKERAPLVVAAQAPKRRRRNQ